MHARRPLLSCLAYPFTSSIPPAMYNDPPAQWPDSLPSPSQFHPAIYTS